jgi:hypothetical protein
MWTHVQYSDISKRRNIASQRGFSRRLVCVLAVLLSGCVVTDKIEFEEAENQPFAILSRDPEGNIIPGDKGSIKNLSVLIWDPDFEEIDDVPLAGKLLIESDRWSSSVTYYCPAPVVPEETIETADESKVIYLLACPFNLPNEISTGTLLEITLYVSDLGFYRNGEAKLGANVVEVNWVIRMQ